MSTYGTAIVIDVADDATLDVAVALLQSPEITTDGVPPRCDLYRGAAPDGRRRVTAYVHQPGLSYQFEDVLPQLGHARIACAEDFDDFGALWLVAAIEDGELGIVHRRYLLNADPTDPAEVAAALDEVGGDDPRGDDVAGDGPAAAAAALFGADPVPVVAAERGSGSAHERMGYIGGPFPWWYAPGLTWPEEGAGTPAGAAPAGPPVTPPAPANGKKRSWWRRGRD